MGSPRQPLPMLDYVAGELLAPIRREQLLADFQVHCQCWADLPDAVPAILEALRRRKAGCVHTPYAVRLAHDDELRVVARISTALKMESEHDTRRRRLRAQDDDSGQPRDR